MTALLFSTFLLPACNTGGSVFEWDEETAAEASPDSEVNVEGGLLLSMGIPRDSRKLTPGRLYVVPATGPSRQVTASLDDGCCCSCGLVATEEIHGTFALSCDSGTVWLGDYVFFADDLGAAQMRDQSGAPARIVYGTDVPSSGLDAATFESLWSSREATAAQ
tara:strand:+ start:502 stop:990 length:489 start_codon:yes stop_codon:yes gene_type:complete